LAEKTDGQVLTEWSDAKENKACPEYAAHPETRSTAYLELRVCLVALVTKDMTVVTEPLDCPVSLAKRVTVAENAHYALLVLRERKDKAVIQDYPALKESEAFRAFPAHPEIQEMMACLGRQDKPVHLVHQERMAFRAIPAKKANRLY
jgi:hypothetical protein